MGNKRHCFVELKIDNDDMYVFKSRIFRSPWFDESIHLATFDTRLIAMESTYLELLNHMNVLMDQPVICKATLRHRDLMELVSMVISRGHMGIDIHRDMYVVQLMDVLNGIAMLYAQSSGNKFPDNVDTSGYRGPIVIERDHIGGYNIISNEGPNNIHVRFRNSNADTSDIFEVYDKYGKFFMNNS